MSGFSYLTDANLYGSADTRGQEAAPSQGGGRRETGQAPPPSAPVTRADLGVLLEALVAKLTPIEQKLSLLNGSARAPEAVYGEAARQGGWSSLLSSGPCLPLVVGVVLLGLFLLYLSSRSTGSPSYVVWPHPNYAPPMGAPPPSASHAPRMPCTFMPP